MSEDEGSGSDPEDRSAAPKVDEAKVAAARKEKEARQEELRKMMEEDVEMADAPTPTPQDANIDEASQDVDEDPTAAPLDSQDAAPSKPAETETVVVEGGRRRGKRRVTKRKKVKDAEGYLGTFSPTLSPAIFCLYSID